MALHSDNVIQQPDTLMNLRTRLTAHAFAMRTDSDRAKCFDFPAVFRMGPCSSLWMILLGAIACATAAMPDFGPSVLVLSPSSPGAQKQVHAIFSEQERAQFGNGRHAILLEPGIHDLDLPVGFFTQISGLGEKPGDVVVKGHVWTDAGWMGRNATCNFWRTVENLTIDPLDRKNTWAVSQAAPMRRVHVLGDLHLSSGGWSSGGFMADCRVDGTVFAGSQQQWFSRHSAWNKWDGGIWNMVFAGCKNPPPGTWPEVPVTVIPKPIPVREKPFLLVRGGAWFVHVPALRLQSSDGPSWDSGAAAGTDIPLGEFHLARPEKDNASTLNAALRAGKHLLFTPGIYPLDDTLVVTRPGTIVLGLGLPSLMPRTGRTVLLVQTGEGAIISGLMIDATPVETAVLVQFGTPGTHVGTPASPVVVHDLFCRVGGYGQGKAQRMVEIHTDHLIGENFWLWRADHGAMAGWTESTCDTGLVVEGDNVTLHGLFVEHTQQYQTIWNGERGRVNFYQSEMPYDPPSQDGWTSPSGAGYASYKIGDKVKTHEAWGLGVYHVFKKAAVIADNAFEAPAGPGIEMNHLFTFRLGGGKPGSGIRHVVSGQGGEVITSQKATVIRHPSSQ